MLLWLIDTFSFPLNTEPLIGDASLSSALNLCRARDKRRNGGWPCVSTINSYKPEQQTIRMLDLVLLSKKINKMTGFELMSRNYSMEFYVKYEDKARAVPPSQSSQCDPHFLLQDPHVPEQ